MNVSLNAGTETFLAEMWGLDGGCESLVVSG